MTQTSVTPSGISCGLPALAQNIIVSAQDFSQIILKSAPGILLATP